MTTIPIGRAHVMVSNLAYAVPGARVLIHVTALGAGSIELSDDNSTWAAVTPDANEQFECAGAFIRCTTAADAAIIRAVRV